MILDCSDCTTLQEVGEKIDANTIAGDISSLPQLLQITEEVDRAIWRRQTTFFRGIRCEIISKEIRHDQEK